MAKRIQLRRGNTAQHATFTGAVGEPTVDTDLDTIVIHDGSKVSGFPLISSTGYNGAMKVSSGTSVQRPVSPAEAMSRYNTDYSLFEGYTGADWLQFAMQDSKTGSLRVSSGTTNERPSNNPEGDYVHLRHNKDFGSMEYSTDGETYQGLGGAKGGPGNPICYENDRVMTESYTISDNQNASISGPFEIGITRDIANISSDGSNITIIFSKNHCMKIGMPINISDTTNYNGNYEVGSITDLLTITISSVLNVANETSGTVELGATCSISSIDGDATYITVQTSTAHYLTAGQRVKISGTTNYNGKYTVGTIVNSTEYTIADTSHDLASEATGISEYLVSLTIPDYSSVVIN